MNTEEQVPAAAWLLLPANEVVRLQGQSCTTLPTQPLIRSPDNSALVTCQMCMTLWCCKIF